jgi:hypothetical protein
MKLLLIYVFGLGCSVAVSQSVYPLAVGNAWHYSISYPGQYPTIPPTSITVRVVGDSLMANGKRYWRLDPPDMFSGRYIRSDSGVIYYWQSVPVETEKRFLNVNSTIGVPDTIRWFGFFYSTQGNVLQYEVLGKVRTNHSFSLGGLVFGSVTLTEGLGYSHFEDNHDGGATDFWQLTGCLLADTLYGTMSSRPVTGAEPMEFCLSNGYPNPFNGSATISYTMASKAFVEIKIFDPLGREVGVLVSEELMPGSYTCRWNPVGLASGVYFCRLEAGGHINTQRLVINK